MRDVVKVLKADARSKDSEIKTVFKGERGVTVNGTYAFEQPQNQKGAFIAPYDNLSLPE